MSKKIISAGLSLVIAGSLLLSACNSPAATPAETLDPNAVYTQAAQTVQAGLEQTQAAKPPSTATPEASPTFDLTAAAALTAVANFTATAQAAALQPTATTGATNTTPVAGAATQTPVVQTTPSSGGSVATSGDKAELVSQSPDDGTKIKKEASWDMKLVVKNTGTTTWTNKYSLKFYAGDRMESPADLFIVGEVKPGEMYTFLFTMKAPNSIGFKQTNWVIQNADGKNFYSMFVKIEVTE